MSLQSQLQGNLRKPEQRKAPLPAKNYSGGSAPAPSRGRLVRQYNAPAQRKAPLRTNQQKSRPQVRPAPTARQAAQARNELFNRRMLALSMLTGPPPSPDRTTGRELAGFASSAFTGRGPFGDAANGFFPDAAGAKVAGYGMRAGNPKQQAIAAKVVERENRSSDTTSGALSALGHATEKALRNLLANSPVGAGVGNVISQQTWEKLAPLFQRSGKDMPTVNFAKTPPYAAGFATIGTDHPSVTISPSNLTDLFSRDAKARNLAAQSFRGLLAHEFSHTQQGQSNDRVPRRDPAARGTTFSPKAEGGAEAFRNAVAPLLGYKPKPVTNRGDYDRAQHAFNINAAIDTNKLRRALVAQFPHAAPRLIPAKQRRINLAQ